MKPEMSEVILENFDISKIKAGIKFDDSNIIKAIHDIRDDSSLLKAINNIKVEVNDKKNLESVQLALKDAIQKTLLTPFFLASVGLGAFCTFAAFVIGTTVGK